MKALYVPPMTSDDGMLAMAASAESRLTGRAREMKATIPFDFIIGSSKLEKGDYRFECVTTSTLLVRSADGRARKLVLPVPIQGNGPNTEAKLIFNRYRDHYYFLSQVWTDSDAAGHELLAGTLETELVRSGAVRELAVVRAELR